MLSLHTIERALETADFDRMVREVAGNGAGLPLPLRVRLSSAEAGAIALGLHRVAELTYGPTSLSRALIARLLELQRADGGFGSDDQPGAGIDVPATAAAAAALGRVLTEHRLYAGDPLLSLARDRALAALAAAQSADALFSDQQDRAFGDRVLNTAFVLSLLGDDPAFRGAVRWAELMSWFDENEQRLPPAAANLWELARAQTQARQDAERLLAGSRAA